MKSSEIESIRNMFQAATSDYKYFYELVGIKEHEENDIRHELELALDSVMQRNDKAKWCTKMRHCLKERREAKDNVELLEPIIKLLDDKHKNLINDLSQALGRMREIEEKHKNRTYIPRVRNDLTIKAKKKRRGEEYQGPEVI